MKQYLIANPAIVVDKFSDRIFLINLLNKEYNEVKKGTNEYTLVEDLFGEYTNGVMDMEDYPTFTSELIKKIIKNNYAKKLNIESSKKPISFNRTEPVILKNPKKILTGVSPEENDFSVGKNICENISDIYIFCGGKCDIGCKSCSYIIKSYPVCNCENEIISDTELLATINITSKLKNKTTIAVNKFEKKRAFFIENRGILNNTHIGINALEYLENEKELKFIFENRITIYFPSSLIKSSILDKFKTKDKKELIFFVEEEDNLTIIESYIIDLSFEHSIKIKPAYNGSNSNFILENICVTKDEVISYAHDFHKVEVKKELNSYFWGKVYFYSKGKFKTSLFQNNYFETETVNLPDAIFVAMTSNNDWNLTRDKIDTCTNCNFRFICPPVSPIEKSMNHFKICKP